MVSVAPILYHSGHVVTGHLPAFCLLTTTQEGGGEELSWSQKHMACERMGQVQDKPGQVQDKPVKGWDKCKINP